VDGRIDVVRADLSRQQEVRALARAVRNRYEALHVLISCAGVITRTREVTVDGVECQLAVNHLAPFLLTHLLLDRLASSVPARIVIVASQVESAGRFDFGDLQMERAYDPLEAYARSKLANVLFTYELARRLARSAITVNCLHPGVVGTNLLDRYVGRPWPFSLVNRLRSKTPREGARPLVQLATAPELATVTGRYFHEGRETSSSARSYDLALAQQLWNVSRHLTGISEASLTPAPPSAS